MTAHAAIRMGEGKVRMVRARARSSKYDRQVRRNEAMNRTGR